ncbi:hypothetical protein [Peribacillus sp. CSMR9]|uniref:hypothetical protein n=1 Tax=Peribacillus sp. CSMR9 TaxID=2981350 RepID=UPI0029532228|nr:hypothetical protein [Peribacillus sp. CSMR9]
MAFLPIYMDETNFDKIHSISDRELTIKEGLFVGNSFGAAFAAAMKEAAKASSGGEYRCDIPGFQ